MKINESARRCTTSAFRLMPAFVQNAVINLIGTFMSVPKKKLAYLKLGCPSVVQAGIFEGMSYIDRATSSALMPKIVGTYELELVPTLQRLKAMNLKTVVDIGAAEGYYAIGLLKFLNVSKCIAFDTDRKARSMLAQMAALNGAEDRIEIRSECSPDLLNAVLKNVALPCLIVCDVDGAETAIINPATSPQLGECVLIIETHDPDPPGQIVETLTHRLLPTHDVHSIQTRERVNADLDQRVRHRLYDEMICAVMDEYRPYPQIWLIAWPKNCIAAAASS